MNISPQVSVRAAKRSDLPDILRFAHLLAKHHNDKGTLTFEDLENLIFDPCPWLFIIVAELDGKIIGQAALSRLIQLQFGAKGMDIHHLFVEQNMRNHGVGSALIDGAIATSRAMGCNYIAVGTHLDNHRAQNLYEAYGFLRQGPSPRFGMRLD